MATERKIMKKDIVEGDIKFPEYEIQNYGEVSVLTFYPHNKHTVDESFKTIIKKINFDRKKVIVDVSLCMYLSLSIWCCIIDLNKELKSNGMQMSLVCNYDINLAVIQQTGVNRIVNIHREVNNAIVYMSSSNPI